eukprot:EG_transcript_26445
MLPRAQAAQLLLKHGPTVARTPPSSPSATLHSLWPPEHTVELPFRRASHSVPAQQAFGLFRPPAELRLGHGPAHLAAILSTSLLFAAAVAAHKACAKWRPRSPAQAMAAQEVRCAAAWGLRFGRERRPLKPHEQRQPESVPCNCPVCGQGCADSLALTVHSQYIHGLNRDPPKSDHRLRRHSNRAKRTQPDGAFEQTPSPPPLNH